MPETVGSALASTSGLFDRSESRLGVSLPTGDIASTQRPLCSVKPTNARKPMLPNGMPVRDTALNVMPSNV